MLLKFVLIKGDVRVNERDIKGEEMQSFTPAQGSSILVTGRNLLIATGPKCRSVLSVKAHGF